jgi:hypothetical protein
MLSQAKLLSKHITFQPKGATNGPTLLPETSCRGNAEGKLHIEEISFLHKYSMFQTHRVLHGELILHILFHKCHVAKRMRFIQPSRDSSAWQKMRADFRLPR